MSARYTADVRPLTHTAQIFREFPGQLPSSTLGGTLSEPMSERHCDFLSFAAASRRFLWRFLPLLVLTPLLGAQDLRYLHHQSWSSEDGLPQNSVHQVLQSADGYIWVATEDGLARFDGSTFQTFTRANTPAMSSNDIWCLANGLGGDLWIGTADGLLRLHAQTFSRVDEHSALIPPQLLTLLRNNSTAPSAEPIPVTGPQGELWNYSKSTVTVTANGHRRQWTGLPGSRIETLFVDRAGTAWVGTNDGLAILTHTSSAPTPIPTFHGNAVLDVYEDREGNHWVGSETSGLHLLNSVKFRTEPALAEKALTALVRATDGAIWLGTRKDGLLRFRDATLAPGVPADKLTSPIILSLAPGSGGAVWAGTPDGLNFVTPSGRVRQITSADGLPDDYIQSLLTDTDGSVWVGTRHGLAHLSGTTHADTRIDILTQADGLGGDLIGTMLLTSAHTLWVGNSGGLSRIVPGQPRAGFTTFTQRDGLPSGIITTLAEDETGTLWIATRSGGLARFVAGHFQTLHTQAGEAEIAGIATDSLGSLWLRTTQGMERASLADLNRCAEAAASSCDPHFKRYTIADGLPTLELASAGSPVILRTPTGELWSTTRRGVAITDPEHLSINPVPPLVALERFLVDEASIPTNSAPINLQYGHTRFTIEYAALTFTTPSEVRYRYRLEGFDPGWIDAGSRRSATYTNLPPQAYEFRVQAANNDGIWSETGAVLRFRVIPPVYRRWWFLALVLIALAAITGLLYRLRLRRLHARFDAVLQERNRLAREIHDTLAQDFVGVSIQLDLAAQFLSMNLVEPALVQVRQARTLVTDGLADARQSIWGLRANLTHDSLPTRLGKVVERYSSDTLPLRTKIGGSFRRLDVRVENEVLRIAQESLSNVQRHSAGTQASIELCYGSDMLVLTVADNGSGFVPEEAATRIGHYGLGGMKERAETIGGTLEIFSKLATGTRITLSVPIPGVQSGDPEE